LKVLPVLNDHFFRGKIKKLRGHSLVYPKYSGAMRVTAFIEDGKVIKRILNHLRLWGIKARLPLKATVPKKVCEYSIDYSARPATIPLHFTG